MNKPPFLEDLQKIFADTSSKPATIVKKYVVVGLQEIPIVSAWDNPDNYKTYMMSIHLGTYTDLNEAEKAAQEEAAKYEHGTEIKTVFTKL